ncbi:PTS beta-glucoside transporter subunit IIABC [Alphaproteobacteria bacterium]|nr:PTS beta-glucoside transporter subunit IIABC [Alphaproteobacteria bacterium]
MTTQKPDQLRQKHGSDDNPFTAMGFFSFWLVSTVFYLTFPLSLGLCLLVMGRHRTKQLIRALVHDFLQTIFILTVVVVLIIWAAWHFLLPLFGG